MNVLITGGAGFVGSHLCDKLIKEGYSVICVDNLITGKSDNIKHLEENENFRFISHDITKYLDIDESLNYIINAASPASPIDYSKFQIQTWKAGTLGTLNMLGLAKKKNAKFLLTSTSEVYGDPLEHPQKEEYWGNVNPIGPRAIYDESKRAAEAITMAYHKKHKIDTKIARIFNSYGEKMCKNDGRAIPNFINQALEERDLTVYGDGSQTRSFCYVSDLIDGLYKLLVSDYNNPINLGNSHEITLLEVAKKIIEIIGSKSKIVYKKLPKDDPKRRCPDITRAKEVLNWKPKVSLEEGLSKTIKYFGD